jgi:hypothetical protein
LVQIILMDFFDDVFFKKNSLSGDERPDGKFCTFGACGLPSDWVFSANLVGPSVGIVTWLILPVVICLSQRLSHACLSINKFIL